MSDRVGQVWWAYHSIVADFEPYVVVGECTLYHLNDAWSLRLVAEIGDPNRAISVYKTSFERVEAGCDDAWVGKRIV